LEIGGSYNEFCSMCYWDYLTLIETIKRKNAAAKGESFVIKGLPEHSKDMIKRRKDMYGKRQNRN
jgi:hypothetical protein